MDTIITLSTTVDNRKSNDHQTTSMYNGNNVTISDKMYQKAIRALLWKLDKRLIPFLTILELFSFLNRINIGNAKIAGIENTLHLTQTEYSWAVSIYFIGFIYRAEDAPYFIRSHLISLGFMVAMLFASLILKYILWRENQHRDHLSPEQRTRELTMCGQEPCDAHPDFRYVT
ncbi:unnamed protein product [Rotaria sordida]|uniref:Uncharacterized protein n=1 Tax=Rotaria sordida TaxID=392033 RepID=A0A819JGF8_9BILA|nr:unnamed protein product [Rotaria sordida]